MTWSIMKRNAEMVFGTNNFFEMFLPSTRLPFHDPFVTEYPNVLFENDESALLNHTVQLDVTVNQSAILS